MTRCVEAYDSYREAKKKVKEAQAQYCKVKRGKRVDYQIDAYDELVCTMVQPELTRDEIICLWPERAARNRAVSYASLSRMWPSLHSSTIIFHRLF